ncbi:MAG: hypothetical protein ABSF09_06870 [Candidatus Bathyarchaeia archaeon]
MQIASQLHDFQSSIAITGKMRALMLEGSGKPGGVFSWAPQARDWLLDSLYVFYLGGNAQP